MIRRIVLAFAIAVATLCLVPSARAVEPKRLLVVSVTAGYRHASIPLAEMALVELGEESHAFTLDFVRQPPGEPKAPEKPKALKPDATAEQKAALDAAMEKYRAALVPYEAERARWLPSVAETLRQLAPSNLARYDGLVLNETTGDLPIPDKQGLLGWVRAGHALIGLHSASDTFHNWPEYLHVIGAEFDHHGAQVPADVVNEDPAHPATAHLPATWHLDLEEIYQFKNFDPAKVHELLALNAHPNDRTPGHYPLAWTRAEGQGRVFYTALGHRDDLWSLAPNLKDRKNPIETTRAFRKHVLGGILWSLNVTP